MTKEGGGKSKKLGKLITIEAIQQLYKKDMMQNF
jgi:hypothetical protein